jgi:prolyl oligopeptidase
LLSHKDAPRFKVIAVDLPSGTVAKARTVIAPSERVVQQASAAKDALYVQSLEDGLGRMTRVDWSGKRGEVPLPVNGTISDLTTDPDTGGFLEKLQSWTVSPLWYIYDPAVSRLVDTKLDPPSPVDYAAITAEEVKVRARDGVMVPLSIIHRKDMRKDGSNPTFVDAYGSYGIALSPNFSSVRLAWFERGGVRAECHVRGGGEYGEEWHLAGKDANKINTISDFIDCAKWLIDNKYTSPAKLGGNGGSAGGITMGGAISQAPELFAAIIYDVPVSDQLRIEFTANGPPNIPEFGSVKTPEGFKNLYATSAIQHLIRSGKYPAVMVTTGVNDPRVDPWQAAKMAATLQTDSAGGKPILLRVEFQGGHGFGETKQQTIDLITDQYTFFLWNMGVAGFQPTD